MIGPVVLELLKRGQVLTAKTALFNCALVDNAASCPMLLPRLVLEGLWAGFAFEFSVVKGLLCKPVEVFAQGQIASTVWAGLVPLGPVSDAGVTAQLVTLLAFFGVLHNHQADRTRKVTINPGHGTFTCKLLAVIAFLLDLAL